MTGAPYQRKIWKQGNNNFAMERTNEKAIATATDFQIVNGKT